MSPPEPSWREEASCRDDVAAALVLFDPTTITHYGERSPRREREALARARRGWCDPCPVRAECLEYAVTTGQDLGIWGGELPQTRRKIRRARERGEYALL